MIRATYKHRPRENHVPVCFTGEAQTVGIRKVQHVSALTWKEVLEACVDATEFRLAQICGLNLITHADVEYVRNTYERHGFSAQLIALI